MSEIFITGAFGFLGQHIVQALHQHDPGAGLRLLVRTPRRLHLPVDQLPQVSQVRGDLLEPAAYAAALEGVETVVHNAALVSFDPADRQAVLASNLTGTQRLLERAAAAGCRNFIFISSISAVATRPPLVSDETFYPEPAQIEDDAYAYSKLLAEAEVNRYAGQMRVLSLNPSVIIGPGSARIEQIAGLVRRLPVLPTLKTINSFVDVRDVATAVALALDQGRSGERYIVTSWNLEMVSFARSVAQAMHKPARILPLSGGLLRLGDAGLALLKTLRLSPGVKSLRALNRDKAYSNEKIRRELGWAPHYTLEASLADSFAAPPGSSQASRNPVS